MEDTGTKLVSRLFSPSVLPFVRRIHDLINKTPSPQLAFITIPLEIIVEIMKVLDWRTLLKIRRTCKYLETTSRLRAVWKGQYYQYLSERVYPTRSEEPLESYSVEELERLVLVRRGADLNWSKDGVQPVRSRNINQRNAGAVCMVPGGRWLLVVDADHGSVAAYDLDAPNSVERPLIPQTDQNAHFIVIDVDSYNSLPNLVFTLVTSPLVHMEPSPLKLDIWRITLQGHATQARLTGELLSSFQADYRHGISIISIRKKLFARRIGLNRIEIFDWEQSSTMSHCKAIILPQKKIESICLLPGSRLVAFSDTHIMIYGFNVVEGMPTTTEPISDITQPLWSLSLAETRTNRGGLSRGMPTPLATQFILTTFCCVVSLVIPHKHDEEPCLSKVAELDTRAVTQTRAGGFEKAIILHRDQMVSRLGFSWGSRDAGNVDPWPPGSCICAISKDYSYLYGGMRPPKFDEGIGRIVQDTRRNILVIDMSLIYMIH